MSYSYPARDVLEECPDREAVVDVDDGHNTWAFDDVKIESGPFGELMERYIVCLSVGNTAS